MRAAVCNSPVLFIFEYIIWIAISSWTNDLFLSTSHGVQWSAEKELYVCNISSEVYYADKKHGMKRRAIIQPRIHARCQDNLIEPLKTKSQPGGSLSITGVTADDKWHSDLWLKGQTGGLRAQDKTQRMSELGNTKHVFLWIITNKKWNHYVEM